MCNPSGVARVVGNPLTQNAYYKRHVGRGNRRSQLVNLNF